MVQTDAAPDTAFLDGLAAVLRDDTLDPAFRALAVSLPSETDTAQAIAQAGGQPDPLAIHHAHEALKLQIAQHLQDIVPRIYAQMTVDGPYDPNAKDAGKRALGNVVLDLISRLDGGAQATSQFAAANNMTQQLTALACCLRVGKGADARAAFFDQWQNDRLVMDKWFGLQVRCAAPDAAVATARMLTDHPKFDWKNPNRFRAVIGGLTGNAAGFHAPDGSGYAFLADCLIRLDPVNPQTTARMATAFDAWAQFGCSSHHCSLKRL
jgi:aminopeptidase N